MSYSIELLRGTEIKINDHLFHSPSAIRIKGYLGTSGSQRSIGIEGDVPVVSTGIDSTLIGNKSLPFPAIACNCILGEEKGDYLRVAQ